MSFVFDVVYAVGDFLGSGEVVVSLRAVSDDDVVAAEIQCCRFLGRDVDFGLGKTVEGGCVARLSMCNDDARDLLGTIAQGIEGFDVVVVLFASGGVAAGA